MLVNKKHLVKALKVVGFVPVMREQSFLMWCKVCGDTASPKHLVKQTGNRQKGIGLGQHLVPCVCDLAIIVVFLPVTCSDMSMSFQGSSERNKGIKSMGGRTINIHCLRILV